MSKSPSLEDVKRSFDSAIIVINEMTQEAADLKQKFGERSKLFLAKVDQIERLKDFYRTAKSAIERQQKLNSKIALDCMSMELFIMQQIHGLPFEKAAKALGYEFSKEFIEVQDYIDGLIKKALKPEANE